MANDDQKQYVRIDVESLLLQAESGKNPVNQRPSICKVPSILRDLSPDSFKPQFVSIGPLHKQDKNVQDIERLKGSYLRYLLHRSPNPPKTKFEVCLQKVKASIPEIKSSYSATGYSDDELADMMVLDCCFILEFCLKEKDLKDGEDSKDEEPTLLNKIQKARIAIDLMLLENQIPFFVLKDIFDLTKPDSMCLSLTSLLHQVLLNYAHPFEIFLNVNNIHDDFSGPNDSSDPEHVLDCLHKIYQFRSSEIVNDCCGMCDVPWLKLCKHVWNMCGLCSCFSKKSKNVYGLHSVVELERSGVNFKPQKKKKKSMAMEFVKASSCVLWPWRKPTLVMPTLIIQDYTEVVLRNFIAYEQFFPKENYFFTSYSCLMDKLINTKADVGNLVKSRVLINCLGSHKQVAKCIKSICKNIEVGQFYYTKEMLALDDYYYSSFAHLSRLYFSNPWNYYNLLAGIILFGLTAVQTIFTVKSYYP